MRKEKFKKKSSLVCWGLCHGQHITQKACFIVDQLYENVILFVLLTFLTISSQFLNFKMLFTCKMISWELLTNSLISSSS